MKIQISCTVILFFFLSTSVFGQNASNERVIRAVRTSNSPVIDGKLDDASWQNVPIATDFTEFRPSPNTPSDFRTEVKVIYDDIALYIGVFCHDPNPELILKQLGERDNFNVNADKFVVDIDALSSKQNGFGFGVTAAGGKTDKVISLDGGDDVWDAVWKVKTSITENGWIAEYKIPYSQIRFSDQEVQTWGINFYREVRRIREESFWAPIDPTINGYVKQFGRLEGITGIKPPVRLSFTPFVVASVKNQTLEDNDGSDWSGNFSGGMDIKYGLNESFTLDLSLIPDFSDVQSDDQVLNLGPFEVFFQENRPFFTEGTEIFGRGGWFYSRRIGSTPSGFQDVEDNLGENETIVSNPTKSPLLNAVKLSGRTKKGLGVGVFNAITGNAFATIEQQNGDIRKELTESLTNYNAFVLDQLLPDNSYISVVNTNVMRSGVATDANVTGSAFRFANKGNNYAIRGKAAISQRFLDSSTEAGKSDVGHTYSLSFAKVSGKFQFFVDRNLESKNYNPNDLGFLFNANELSHAAGISYRTFKPLWIYNRLNIATSIYHSQLFEPRAFTEMGMEIEVFSMLKGFFAAGFSSFISPVVRNDYFEARQDDTVLKRPKQVQMNGWFSSDYRKVFALDGGAGFSRGYGLYNWNSLSLWGRLAPRIRFSDKFNLVASIRININNDQIGYANTDENDNPVIGLRNFQTLTNSLTAQYLFNSRMSLNLRARHNWTEVTYNRFFDLNSNGLLTSRVYEENEDVNFNAFNLDLIYRWRFAPGSELNLVWKNSVISIDENVNQNYLSNFTGMFEEDDVNVLSLKILYFLDYQQFVKKPS